MDRKGPSVNARVRYIPILRDQRHHALRAANPVLLFILSLPKRDDGGGLSPHLLYLHV